MARPQDIRQSAPAAEGTRVTAFARIERETADPTTDPKVMAMARARRAVRSGDLARLSRLSRED